MDNCHYPSAFPSDETFTGHQQFYVDHEWFIEFDQELPGHGDPLRIEGYPMQFMMGYARHGIHTTWCDDPRMRPAWVMAA